jgi:hypothetical protein
MGAVGRLARPARLERSREEKGGCYCVISGHGHARRRAIRQLLKARWRAWSAGVLPRGEGGTGKDAHDKKFQNTRMGGARAGSTQVFLRALLKNEFAVSAITMLRECDGASEREE